MVFSFCILIEFGCLISGGGGERTRTQRTENRVELELVTLIFKLVKKFSSLGGRAEGAYEKLF